MHRTFLTVIGIVLLAWAIAGGDSTTYKGDAGTITTTTTVSSGTLTANQGTSPWVTSGTVTATQGTSPFVTSINTGTYAASVETRKQTPTGTNALNVMIGPGDVISNIPVVTLFEHHQMHEGEAFMAQSIQASLGTGSVQYAVTTGTGTATTHSPHLAVDVDVYNGAVQINLYAEATYTSGVTVTPVNRNRNVSLPAGIMTVKSGVTSTNGTLIESHYVGSGTRSAGSGGNRDEWILKPNTTYRIDLIGLVANTQAILHLNWYEDLGL